MKTCITIKSFCNKEEKLRVLRNCISFLKNRYKLPILLHAGYKVPSDIIESVDYCITYNNSVYGKQNGMFAWRSISKLPGKFYEAVTEYGYAEFLQLIETAQFAKLHGFAHMHTINYDVDFTHFEEHNCLEEHEALLTEGYEACFHTKIDFYAGTLFYSLNTQALLEKVDPYMSIDDFSSLCAIDYPWVPENGFYQVFTKLRFKITRENFQLRDLITIVNLLNANLPYNLKPTMESAGLYKKPDDGYYLLCIPKEMKKIKYLIDGEEYQDDSSEHLIELRERPRQIIVEIDGIRSLLFIDEDIEKMEGVLLYEIDGMPKKHRLRYS